MLELSIMPTPPGGFEPEKSELRAVLASGLFRRARNLEHLLTYVCEKHFNGQDGNVKEYNIAVEALGRPPDFDQKRDSIVRVEAHRLRRRLSEYYAGEGARHAVHIMVPPGQYAPKFVYKDSFSGELGSADSVSGNFLQPANVTGLSAARALDPAPAAAQVSSASPSPPQRMRHIS